MKNFKTILWLVIQLTSMSATMGRVTPSSSDLAQQETYKNVASQETVLNLNLEKDVASDNEEAIAPGQSKEEESDEEINSGDMEKEEDSNDETDDKKPSTTDITEPTLTLTTMIEEPTTTTMIEKPTLTTSTTVTPTPGVGKDEDITVRFYKPNTWDVVNLWSWDSNGGNLVGDVWPGKTIEDLKNGWWSYTYASTIDTANLLFTDEGRAQTGDINGISSNSCFRLDHDNAVVKTVDCGLDVPALCQIDPAKRIQCGSASITQDKCMEQNCCYNELAGYPSCFFTSGAKPNPTNGSCHITDGLSRTACGSENITEAECTKKRCCWDDSDAQKPSCFNHAQLLPTCFVEAKDRQTCGPEGVKADVCRSTYGCCFDESNNTCFQKGVSIGPEPEASKYKVTQLKKSSKGMSAVLDLEGSITEKYDIDIQTLALEALYETKSRLHIKIGPTEKDKYPHNGEIPPVAYPETPVNDKKVKNPFYTFNLVEGDNFNLVIQRSGNSNQTIFDTTNQNFIFEQQYLQLTSTLPAETNIYGFGEVVSSFKRNLENTKQTLWNLDAATPKDQNVYGSHPFYIEINQEGQAHGVFLKNSHGMDFILQPGLLSINAIGGMFDLYFFMGPTVEEVIAQYYKVIGQPGLLPYWSLGFHQCRYGYKNIDEVETVVSEYKKNNIPLDTMWIDIDYMDGFKDFTYDPINFPISRMKNFVKNLKANHQYYINMIDPAISTNSTYETYIRGVEKDIFVKDARGELFVGKVWPGETVFPDWHHPNIREYWKNEIKIFKDMAMTDGNWIDMNEAANFCNGACAGSTTEKPYTFGEFNPANPPYGIFNNKNVNTPLKFKNLDMDAQYHGGLIEYDIHNIYGHMESIVTFDVLRQIDNVKRPFLLSRSTFPGTGKYAAHWLGDNYSTWEYLYLSIPGMLNFQMFGIPMVGSDICGFNTGTTEELCARWMELGAFYPFARNHNAINEIGQEPYLWESVAEASRNALSIRYEILPYWYTLLIRSHTDSKMMVTPVPFEWPTDKMALDIDKQFLVGKGLLVTPVLEEGATSVSGYFPDGVWYDWYDNKTSFTGPVTKTIEAPLTKIPVHIRGGYIIPTQGPALNLYENRNLPYGLIVPLNAKKQASGEIYIDDGVSYDIKGKKTEIQYTVKKNVLYAKGSYKYNEKQNLESVKILGLTKKPSKITLKQRKTSTRIKKFIYGNGVLEITGLKINMNFDFMLSWN